MTANWTDRSSTFGDSLEQVEHVMESIRQRGRDVLAIHSILSDLQHHSPALLHAVLREHVEALSEFVQGQGLDNVCAKFGQLPRRWKALHIAAGNIGLVDEIIADAVHSIRQNAPANDTAAVVEVVVLSDGEHVGSSGDLGIWCAAGVRTRAALHAAMGGLHPQRALAVVLDLGTDNAGLRADNRYGGTAARRVRGSEAAKLWQETLDAVARHAPRALVHYDSFAPSPDVRQVLDAQGVQMPMFNEAADAPAALALAGVLAAGRLHWNDGKNSLSHQVWRPPVSTLQRETFLLFGGFQVTARIARLLVHTLESIGVPPPRARQRIWLFDPDRGLFHQQSEGEQARSRATRGRRRSWRTVKQDGEAYDAMEAHGHVLPASLRGLQHHLPSVVSTLNITVLVGASDRRGAFDIETIRRLHRNTRFPLIMTLRHHSAASGSTECSTFDLEHAGKTVRNATVLYLSAEHPQHLSLTDSDASSPPSTSPSNMPRLVKTRKHLRQSQASALFLYPALSLAVHTCGAKRVSLDMLQAAAEALATKASVEELYESGALFPRLSRLRHISSLIAAQIIEAALRDNLCSSGSLPAESDKLVELLRGREYSPLDAPEVAWTDTGKASFARPQTTVVASGRASSDLVHVDL